MRTAVLISGSGTNLQAILDARQEDPSYPAELVVVVSDRHGAEGVVRAAAAGIPAEVVDWSDFADRPSFTSALCDLLDQYRVQLVVLAGFMRVLSPVAVERYPNAIINIHPALLPSFPGAHAIDDALAYGVKTTGVTVHFVDEHVDHGPIIAQESLEVFLGDTISALHERIQVVEHAIYPRCVAAAAAGWLRVEGRTVIWDEH